MGWKITATVATDEGVFKETYTHQHTSNPSFAYGFVCGYACARGVKPEDVLVEYEHDDA